MVPYISGALCNYYPCVLSLSRWLCSSKSYWRYRASSGVDFITQSGTPSRGIPNRFIPVGQGFLVEKLVQEAQLHSKIVNVVFIKKTMLSILMLCLKLRKKQSNRGDEMKMMSK
jgi:hypothetical protein